jgi:phosphoribosylformylglycinamidine synthase
VVGLLEHADRVVSGRFKSAGDAVMLLGEGRGELGGSEYLKLVYDQVRGLPPALDLDRERALQDLLVRLAAGRLVRSADDCSDGGIAVTLAESCFGGPGIGTDISIDAVGVSSDPRLEAAAALFGESASRVVVSVAPENVTQVVERAAAAGVPARVIGQTGGSRLRIATGGQVTVDVSIEDAERAWSAAIDSYFAKKIA